MTRKILLFPGTVVLVSLLTALVAAGAVSVAEGRSAVRLEEDIRSARAAADRLTREIGSREAEVRLLRERIADLEGANTALQSSFEQQALLFADSKQLIGQLEGALGGSGELAGRFTLLSEQHSVLQSQYALLQSQHAQALASRDQLQAKLGTLTPILTPEVSGTALYLDRTVPGVTYTGAICSGSMEPNITCQDLLVLYEPRVTDLSVGDVIYFKKRDNGCATYVDGRFMLHRITSLVLNSQGLHFRTKGDNLANTDPCLVHESDVLFKLLTVVKNARIQDN
jgi:signal peptidase I